MIIPLSKPDISGKEKQYLMEVLDCGQLSFGEKLIKFEQMFCQRFNVPYAVAMNSGTSALHVAVKALGLKAGDEVITTPYSFVASSNCLVYEGVKPIFVDINPQTLNIDTVQIVQAITPRTRAILVVHVFGQPCNMDEIISIAKQYKLAIIEDACEAIGAQWDGKAAGTLGDVGIFAFYPNKQITTGEGGILLTKDKSIYEIACSLRNQGRSLSNEWLNHERIGYNYRMSDLQAAVGVAQMERLDAILNRRAEVAQRYVSLIEEYKVPVKLPTILPKAQISWFVFVVMLPQVNRNLLMKGLAERGIQTKPYFPSIHLQSCYQKLFGFHPGDFPQCEKSSESTIALPFYNALTVQEQRYVIQKLTEELKRLMQADNNV